MSHGGAISSLVNAVIVPNGYATYGPSIQPCRFWNCSISDIHIYKDQPGEIVRWADVAHLEEPAHKVVNVDENIAA